MATRSQASGHEGEASLTDEVPKAPNIDRAYVDPVVSSIGGLWALARGKTTELKGRTAPAVVGLPQVADEATIYAEAGDLRFLLGGGHPVPLGVYIDSHTMVGDGAGNVDLQGSSRNA
jgi:hypothetical protein